MCKNPFRPTYLLFLSILLFASGVSSQQGPPGLLDLLFLNSIHPGVDAVVLHLNSVEVHREDTGWMMLSNVPRDLVLGKPKGTVEPLLIENLPSGYYTQLRFYLAGAEVIVNNEPQPATFPSSSQSGVMVIWGFRVEEGRHTALTLDMDAISSLKLSGKKWILTPVFRVIGAQILPVAQVRNQSQLEALELLEGASSEPVELRFHEAFGTPAFLSGEWNGTDAALDPAARAMEFLGQFDRAFGRNRASDDFYVESSNHSETLGLTSVKVVQLHRGFPVLGAGMIVGIDPGRDARSPARVRSVRGTFVPGLDVDTTPRLTDVQAALVVYGSLLPQVPGPDSISFPREPFLVVFSSPMLTSLGPRVNALAWLIQARTSNPPEGWQYLVDARTGSILAHWSISPTDHPSQVWDAKNNILADFDLWFQNHVLQRPGPAPLEADLLNGYGGIYFNYLKAVFGIDSIDGKSFPLIGYFNYPYPGNACWNCLPGEALFGPGMVTLDIVAHEFTHGLVEKRAGGLDYVWLSGALNESFADLFGEYLDFRLSGASTWENGRDAFGRLASSGVLRSLANPPLYGQPDHMDNLKKFLSCSKSNDWCGVHTNSGIPNKVGYLLARGGNHYGIEVHGLGLEKAERLLFATLVDAGLTSTAGFHEYRDVMMNTCHALRIRGAGFTQFDCGEVYKAWCTVGICYLNQTLAGSASQDEDRWGYEVAAGDFNGDGRKDVATSSPGTDFTGAADAGALNILYGSSLGITNAGAEFLHQGHAGGTNKTGDQFGISLAAGDFNGDGFDDLAVGVPYKDIGAAADAGVVYVFYGGVFGLLESNTARTHVLTPSDTAGGVEAGAKFGWSLAVGDFNRDGRDDLAVGTPFKDVLPLTKDHGQVTVFFGSSTGLRSAINNTVTQTLNQANLGELPEHGDRFGWSLAVGDFNADLRADLVIGTPHEDLAGVTDVGLVTIVYGSPGGLVTASAENISQATFRASGAPHDRFGWSIAAGDFDGDGRDDLAVGSPYKDAGVVVDSGVVDILSPGPAGFVAERGGATWRRFSQLSFNIGNRDFDQFGWRLSSGNFNGDIYRDLVIGIPYKDVGNLNLDMGSALVLFGTSLGLLDLASPAFRELVVEESVGGLAEPGDRFGFSLAAGDYDGDGRQELILSAPWEDKPASLYTGGMNVGALFLWRR